jgi:hypothetical protein
MWHGLANWPNLASGKSQFSRAHCRKITRISLFSRQIEPKRAIGALA